MGRFTEPTEDFVCPYRDRCPHLEGLSTSWVWERYQECSWFNNDYEYQLEQMREESDQDKRTIRKLEKEIEELKAQLHALHQRQFKGRKKPRPETEAGEKERSAKKRGAPVGHAPWVRPKPSRIDRVGEVALPKSCPDCQCPKLEPLKKTHEHIQEDIVLEPRTMAICYQHKVGYCPACQKEVWGVGLGELPHSYIGPAAKATAIYLRYEMNASYRKISRFFKDFFGLQFVPASCFGFEQQASRRGAPLYRDLHEKIHSLAAVHADETSWRHDGENYWVWYAGNDELAYFLFDPHRSGQTAQKLLGEKFSGVLISDAYNSYNAVETLDWQSCLAHLKRKAEELEKELALLKGKARDERAQVFCQKVKRFFGQACQEYHKFNRSPWRAKRARKKEKELRQELAGLCRKPLRYEPAEAFRERLIGPEQKQMFTFLRHKGVPPTNNQAERSLRPVVIMRKVIQCTRSEAGLENHSVLHSLKETAQRQGKKVHVFFQELFTKDTAQAQEALYRRSCDTS